MSCLMQLKPNSIIAIQPTSQVVVINECKNIKKKGKVYKHKIHPGLNNHIKVFSAFSLFHLFTNKTI